MGAKSLWTRLEARRFSGSSANISKCLAHVSDAVPACAAPAWFTSTAIETFLSEVSGRSVTTIEGLSADSSHPVQKAWLKEQVPQCGYCQSGQIMSAAALLARNSKPSRDEIVDYMSAHICRCGTYPRILRAIERASQEG
jgi:aerobic-type carbon monoxide dehydrogenase small subunit (CoxS/CutS family)